MSSEKKGKKNNKSQVTWIKKYKLKLMQGTETKKLRQAYMFVETKPVQN